MFNKKFKIYFDQVDSAGILYFAAIFPLMHKTYEDLINSLNLDINYFNNDKFIVPIVHSEADYLNPICLHEQIRIEISVSQIRDSSFELNYTVKNIDDVKKVKAKTVHVLVNKNNFQKIPIPETLRSKLNSFFQK